MALRTTRPRCRRLFLTLTENKKWLQINLEQIYIYISVSVSFISNLHLPQIKTSKNEYVYDSTAKEDKERSNKTRINNYLFKQTIHNSLFWHNVTIFECCNRL